MVRKKRKEEDTGILCVIYMWVLPVYRDFFVRKGERSLHRWVTV